MNDSYRNKYLNIVLRPNTNSPTLYHNYILRIYLKNYRTNPLTSKAYEAIPMSYNYDN